MPFDALVLSFAVSVVFVGFAGVLAFVDHWSGQPRTGASAEAAMSAPKRRSF